MPRILRRWSFLKKSPRHLGDDPGRPPEGHVWTPPPVQEESLDSCGAGSGAAMCGRPLRCKKNLWTAAALDRVLPCVRPLLRRLTGRGPVWEFVDQVHITEARSKRSPFAWFS